MTTQVNPISLKGARKGIFSVFTTGFALFSMFFGAGNLIFPLIIGRSTGGNWGYALFGLAITAVIVPFLGLAGMIFFQANCRNFLNRLGTIPGFLLLLLLQLILGPLGVIPRLFTLMHAILKPYFYDIPLPLFSVIVAVTIFICSSKKQNLIRILGIVLTPILLISLACLFVSGAVYKSSTPSFDISPINSFWLGFLGGYNTMDLIAAFLFATVVLPHFQKEVLLLETREEQKKAIFRKVFFSSLVAASLLLLTYIGICFISCYHAPPESSTYPSEALLGLIAHKLLGSSGGFIAAIAIVTACLTTAITLTLIFAEYLQKDIYKEKIKPTTSLLLTLLFTVGMANLGFKGIASFLSPILEICYPGLIVLTILNIFYYFTGFKAVKLPVFLTFGASALLYII